MRFYKIILSIIIVFFTILIGRQICFIDIEGMKGDLASSQNNIQNSISSHSELLNKVSDMKDKQPATLSQEDIANRASYQPIQVTCTIQDCSMAQLSISQGMNLATDNYFNDGKRDCNQDICNKIQTAWQTLTPVDAQGSQFMDNDGNLYDFLGNKI
jgi:hypothetical protein